MKKITFINLSFLGSLLLCCSSILPAEEIQTQNLARIAAGYKYSAPLKVETTNELLKALIADGWNTKKLEEKLGRPDSFYHGYFIYFSTGISARVTRKYSPFFDVHDVSADKGPNRVLNIVINGKYTEDLINGLNINSTKSEVIKALGTPQFESAQAGKPGNDIFGYKTVDYYIFFTGGGRLEEISIYKVDKNYDRTVLKTILQNFYRDGFSLDLLASKWPEFDYRRATPDSEGSWNIEYISRGVVATLAGGNLDQQGPQMFKIEINKNFTGELTDQIALPDKTADLKDFKNEFLSKDQVLEISFDLDNDSVFNAEIHRAAEKAADRTALEGDAASEGKLSPKGTKKIVKIGWNNATYGFIVYDLKNEVPPVEAAAGYWFDLNQMRWLSERYFVYWIDHGIYIFDTAVNSRIVLTDGQPCKMISVVQDVITYRVGDEFDLNGITTFRVKYDFDRNKDIILNKKEVK
jgi:hypothetical protein